MERRIPVFVHAQDPVSRAGILTQLRCRPEIEITDSPTEPGRSDGPPIGLVVSDEVDAEAVRAARALQRSGCPRVVFVAGRLEDGSLLAAVEAGATAVLRRSEATAERLGSTIRKAAAGDGSVPPDLLGRLLEQVGRLQRQVLTPRGLTFNGLTEREVCVLRLVADGHDTSEIATRLAYSERTIKNIIHDLTSRLNLKNRTHAVAYALREGIL